MGSSDRRTGSHSNATGIKARPKGAVRERRLVVLSVVYHVERGNAREEACRVGIMQSRCCVVNVVAAG